MSSSSVIFSGTLDDYGYTLFDTTKRHAFIKKVYTILFFQLALTALISCIFIFNEQARNFAQNNVGAFISAVVLSFVFLIVIMCCGNIAKQTPYNYILLFGFTLCEGYLVGIVTTYYQATSVVMAVVITGGITVSLTVFAFQTKYDFTGLGPYLLCALFGLIMFGFLSAIFCSGGNSCQTLNLVYAWIGAVYKFVSICIKLFLNTFVCFSLILLFFRLFLF